MFALKSSYFQGSFLILVSDVRKEWPKTLQCFGSSFVTQGSDLFKNVFKFIVQSRCSHMIGSDKQSRASFYTL